MIPVLCLVLDIVCCVHDLHVQVAYIHSKDEAGRIQILILIMIMVIIIIIDLGSSSRRTDKTGSRSPRWPRSLSGKYLLGNRTVDFFPRYHRH